MAQANLTMAQISLNCPHCLTKGVGFQVQGWYGSNQRPYEYVALFRCGVCDEGVTVRFSGPGFPSWVKGGDSDGGVRIVDVWPKPPVARAPASVPENVRKFYLQGISSLDAGNYDAAGAMFRKCVDAGLRCINPSAGGSLQNRIEALPTERSVTPTMKRWAHEIRRLGNDAVHEEEPFEKPEATDLQRFTELFLTYAFTLPAEVDKRFSKETAQ